MRNVLMVLGMLMVLVVCWLTLREVRMCNERMDELVAKVDQMHNVRVVMVEDAEVEKDEDAKVVAPPTAKPKKEKSKKSEAAKSESKSAEVKREESAPAVKEKKVVGKDDVVITHFKKDAYDDEEIITFKNNTDSKINRIEGIIVYKDMSGNDISYNELNLKISIAPGMSKQTKISSFDQDHKYCYHKDFQSHMEVIGKRPFKYEFRLISYK